MVPRRGIIGTARLILSGQEENGVLGMNNHLCALVEGDVEAPSEIVPEYNRNIIYYTGKTLGML